jgi:hypothetical protein
MKPFKWLLDGPHLKLKTELSPEQFIDTFARCVDAPHHIPAAGYTGSSQMLGTLTGTNFKLQERCWYRNSGLPYFYGRIQSNGRGSEISGYFSVHPLMKPFMIVWLSLALMFSAIGCFATANSLLEGTPNAIWGFLAALGATVLLTLAAVFMRVIGKGKEEMYLAFFRETFAASLIERTE